MYIPTNNPQGGDEDISPFSAMEAANVETTLK
jgi:hypothetical protein